MYASASNCLYYQIELNVIKETVSLLTKHLSIICVFNHHDQIYYEFVYKGTKCQVRVYATVFGNLLSLTIKNVPNTCWRCS